VDAMADVPRVRSTKRCVVVFLFGYPGSGKTTVGRRLAGLFGKRYVDCDALYTAEDMHKIKALTMAIDDASDFLDRVVKHLESFAHEDIIIASQSLFYRHDRRRLRERFGNRLVLVYLDVSVELSVQRIAQREASDTLLGKSAFYTADLWLKEVEYFEEADEFDIKVTPTMNVDGVVQAIVHGLKAASEDKSPVNITSKILRGVLAPLRYD